MKTRFPTIRGRIAASATAIVGLSALGACDTKTAPDAEVYAPQQVTTPQQTNSTTTFAIGEEDGGYASPSETYATTFAVGEEEGAGSIQYDIGTPPIGEVEGEYERIFIPPLDDNVGQPVNSGVATTLAIGEEG